MCNNAIHVEYYINCHWPFYHPLQLQMALLYIKVLKSSKWHVLSSSNTASKMTSLIIAYWQFAVRSFFIVMFYFYTIGPQFLTQAVFIVQPLSSYAVNCMQWKYTCSITLCSSHGLFNHLQFDDAVVVDIKQ